MPIDHFIRPDIRFRAATLRAVKHFAGERPWHGTLSQRRLKYRRLSRKLAGIYGIDAPLIKFARTVSDDNPFASGWYDRLLNIIGLEGRYSVVTLLHEFGHALGKDERLTRIWSINLFRLCFPHSYARAVEGERLYVPAP